MACLDSVNLLLQCCIVGTQLLVVGRHAPVIALEPDQRCRGPVLGLLQLGNYSAQLLLLCCECLDLWTETRPAAYGEGQVDMTDS